jgi:hypothetical protein
MGGMLPDDGTQTFKLVPGNKIWIPATDFVASASGPTLEIVDAIHHGFLLASDATEAISVGIMMPKYWTSVNIDVYGYNASSGSGGVALGYYIEDLIDDASLTAETPTAVVSQTFTADAEDVLDVIQLARAVVVTPDTYHAFKLARIHDNAADTLANDWGVLGVTFEVNTLA